MEVVITVVPQVETLKAYKGRGERQKSLSSSDWREVRTENMRFIGSSEPSGTFLL